MYGFYHADSKNHSKPYTIFASTLNQTQKRQVKTSPREARDEPATSQPRQPSSDERVSKLSESRRASPEDERAPETTEPRGESPDERAPKMVEPRTASPDKGGPHVWRGFVLEGVSWES